MMLLRAFLSFQVYVVISLKSFYIYDWPDLVNRYANHSDRGHHPHGIEMKKWRLNNGCGRVLNKTNSEYKTSQYSLFKIMYERALVDTRRTHDINKASTFLIPFDLGMHATFLESNGRMRRTGCPLGRSVVERLGASKQFKAKNGHDHLLIVSINQNMNYYLGAQRCVDVLTLCWNCTKIAPDEYLFTARDRSFELSQKGINWHAVPFPGDFHYDSAASRTVLPPWERVDVRDYVVCFVGNAKRYNDLSTQIREALLQQCQAHSKECVHGHYYHDAKHSLHAITQTSVFCLQPPGDAPTRKSLFDSVLSGCIPVLFHPLTARFMYEWHWGQQIWEDVSVSFDTAEDNKALLGQTTDFVAKLIDLYVNHSDVIARKQAIIRRLAFQVQYSLSHNTAVKDVASKKQGVSSRSDAYDITMDRVLSLHTGNVKHERTSQYVECKQEHGKQGSKLQSTDWCNSTGSVKDPFFPPSLVSVFSNVV